MVNEPLKIFIGAVDDPLILVTIVFLEKLADALKSLIGVTDDPLTCDAATSLAIDVDPLKVVIFPKATLISEITSFISEENDALVT